MKVESIEAAVLAEWDAVASTSPEAWLYHTSGWLDIESETARSHAFLVRADRQVIAICPVFLERWRYAGLVPATVLHTGRARGGPALVDGLSHRQRHSAQTAILDHLDSLARTHRVDRLQLRFPTLAPAYLPPKRPPANPWTALRPLTPIRYGRSLARSELLNKIVDLQATEEQLWSGLNSNCRKAIRKSHAAGIAVVEAGSRDLVKAYHHIHTESFAHSGAAALPLSHFERMWDRLHGYGHLRLYFAEYEGQKIAGLLALHFKTGATYWGGGSRPTFQHLRPNNLLMWEAMRRARDDGRHWFELGPTFPTLDAGSKASQIGRFKDQFGGTLHAAFEGTYDWRPTKMAMVDIADGLAGRIARLRERRARQEKGKR